QRRAGDVADVALVPVGGVAARGVLVLLLLAAVLLTALGGLVPARVVRGVAVAGRLLAGTAGAGRQEREPGHGDPQSPPHTAHVCLPTRSGPACRSKLPYRAGARAACRRRSAEPWRRGSAGP